MPATETLFDSSDGMLKAGEDVAVPRDDESIIGDFHEMISGGGMALRYMVRGAKAVPMPVKFEDVEILKFFSLSSLAGEWADTKWWLREDSFNVPATDALHAKYAALKKSWARVNKDALRLPLYAPRFVGAAGSKEDFDLLKQRAIDLHNAGKAPGLIAVGSRDKWLRAPMAIWPPLRDIRAENAEALDLRVATRRSSSSSATSTWRWLRLSRRRLTIKLKKGRSTAPSTWTMAGWPGTQTRRHRLRPR